MISLVRPPCDEGVVRGAPETPGCASHAKRWVLLATILGSSVAFLEASVINVALPAIQTALGASMAGMQWVASAYTLLLAALTLAGGAAGDRFGTRRLFAAGTAILGLASVGCGLATTSSQLIAGRAIQGCGAALLVPNSLALLSASFPTAERGRVIGTWSAFTALTGAVGPILGGWLVDLVSWRAGFLSIVPLAIATLVVTHLRVPDPPRRRVVRAVDWWGAALATAGLTGFVFAIIASGSSGTPPGLPIAALVVGIAGVAGFAVLESRSQAPMVPPALFRSGTFRGVNLLTLLLYFGVSAAFFVLPFNLIQVQGYSATLTGAAYLPFALLVGGLSRSVGTLGDRLGVKPLLVVGPLVAAAGLALFALPRIGGSYWTTFFPPMLLTGIGMALTVAPLTSTVMGTVTPSEAGVASGVNNTVARVAALLAVAIVGTLTLPLFSRALTRRLEPVAVTPAVRQLLLAERRSLADIAIPASIAGSERPVLQRLVGDAFVESFQWVAIISACCALAGAIGAAALIQVVAPAGADDATAACGHLDQIRELPVGELSCPECLARGDAWVHLRLCLTCGHVGCCDSSKNRHASAHFWATRHPIVRSLEPGEDWRWCYVDEIVV
ncbi:MAG TPA: MFS transporter [Candidatus Eisenbacteria bacterium]|nr:MFS transporter [Candidatus Eisenbacteria bacterium]